ncbi:hypothetical protein GHT09_003912 [Marmota monax]|uniref:Uncharacterized protein n=1 Tax=Marmota monax TaxID=9995 RepID=A0A834QUM4_MARMO|nr:hypothetical protein GHT09_003912 [Marmota monax]
MTSLNSKGNFQELRNNPQLPRRERTPAPRRPQPLRRPRAPPPLDGARKPPPEVRGGACATRGGSARAPPGRGQGGPGAHFVFGLRIARPVPLGTATPARSGAGPPPAPHPGHPQAAGPGLILGSGSGIRVGLGRAGLRTWPLPQPLRSPSTSRAPSRASPPGPRLSPRSRAGASPALTLAPSPSAPGCTPRLDRTPQQTDAPACPSGSFSLLHVLRALRRDADPGARYGRRLRSRKEPHDAPVTARGAGGVAAVKGTQLSDPCRAAAAPPLALRARGAGRGKS